MNSWLENKIKQGIEPNTEAPLGTPDNPSSKILTIANAITFMRMALTAIFLWMFVTDVNRYISVAVYAVAACTDWMDGQIARKTQTVSWFGKLLDPVCDRFLLFCGVLGLVIRAELPVWVAVWVIGRDLYLAWGMAWVRTYRERPIDVIFVGKAATACLMFGFCDMLLGWPVLPGLGLTNIDWLPLLNHTSGAFGLLAVYIGCVFSVIACLVYTYEGLAIVNACKRHQIEADEAQMKAADEALAAKAAGEEPRQVAESKSEGAAVVAAEGATKDTEMSNAR